MNSYSNTVKYGAGCTFFEVSPTDPYFQQGRVVTTISAYPDDRKVTSFISYIREFAEDIEIVTWLAHIIVDCNKTGILNIDIEANVVQRQNFELVYGVSRKSQDLLSVLGSTWIAYPKSKPGIDSGRIDKLKLDLARVATEALGTVRKEAMFKKTFKKPPQVWIALCGINLTCVGDNVRLKTQVVKDSITTTGFNYEIISWGKTLLETVSLYWLAVELE